MNDTKKKFFLKVAGLMVAIMMLTMCIVAGTMAKYVSSGKTTGGTVTVAKWDIDVSVGEGAAGDLSTTVNLGSATWIIQPIKTNTAANNAVEANKIAPGTWGYTSIKVENKGDVDATLKVTGDPKPSSGAESGNLQFKVVAMDSAGASYAEMTTKDGGNLTSGVKVSKTNGVITIYICYEWKYEADGSADTNDGADTTMGTTGGELTLGTLTITATQVEPEKETA